MHPQGDKMHSSAPSSQGDDVFLDGNRNTIKHSPNPVNASTTPRLPTAVSYDSIKPKHFHHPEYFNEDALQTPSPTRKSVNYNPESGVDHSSLLEELPAKTDHDYADPADMDKSTWYSRWEDKESIDQREAEERRKKERKRKTEQELQKLKCGLGKIILKEEKEEEIRILQTAFDPRLSSRSPNANIAVQRKMWNSTSASPSSSRVSKHARKSVDGNLPTTRNGSIPISKIAASDLESHAPGSDGRSSQESSESGSNFALNNSHCSMNVVQSMPDIRGSHKIFPYEVLRTTSIRRPRGADKTSLEKHLHPAEFFKVFSMTPEEFYRLPGWRQLEFKKKVHLF